MSSAALVPCANFVNDDSIRSRIPAADASMVVTDAQGLFEFRNLKGGSVSLQITSKGYVTKRVDDLDPNVAEKSRDLRIVLEQGAEVTRRVRGLMS